MRPLNEAFVRAYARENETTLFNVRGHRYYSSRGFAGRGYFTEWIRIYDNPASEYVEFMRKCIDHAIITGDDKIAEGLVKRLHYTVCDSRTKYCEFRGESKRNRSKGLDNAEVLILEET